MKKILLFAILSSTTVFAQDLYDQTAGGNGSGIVSNRYTDLADTTISSADDFTVGAGDVWTVTDVTVSGFRNGTGAAMTEMTVEIFSDNAGVPGTSLYSANHTLTDSIPAPVSDTAINITLNTPLTLDAGVYWLSVTGATPSTGRWNWGGVAGSFGAEGLLIDADDYFGAGATSWTGLTGLGLTWSSLSFKIGGGVVSVEDTELNTLTVYPNPATTTLTLGNVDLATLKSVKIYNVSGQLVSTLANTTNQIDVADLATGSYVVEISTANGTVRKQFMKN